LELSIVTTLYCSAPYLEEFHARMKREAEKITDDYEIILVNDGSPDSSIDIALALYESDRRVTVIDLSRNFGQHKAIMTGLQHAKGRWVFLIDCDLEEDPELLGRFLSEMKDSHADVVYGVLARRRGSLSERITRALFYKLFNLLSSYPIPANVTCARLMTQRYVSSLVQHRDRAVFLAGLWAITGFKQVPVIVQKHDKGKSAYGLARKISILVDAITSFSNKPLYLIFYLGCAIAFVSAVSALALALRVIFFGQLLPGWSSLIVSVWLLGGLILLCLGIIGIYLSEIFTETKERPYAVIRQVYDRRDQS